MPYKDKTKQRQAIKAIIAKRTSEGKCRCGRERIIGYTRCKQCAEESKLAIIKRNQNRRDKGLCLQCGGIRNESGFAKCKKCRNISRDYMRRRKQRLIDAYGGRCDCCGESNPMFLTLDHINNDGGSHRRQIPSADVYRWLEKQGYPRDGFRLLCFNCNLGRQCNGGICPHKLVALTTSMQQGSRY